VTAGAAQTITLPSTASLTGSANDDGLPTGSSLTYAWTKVSGSGNVFFTSSSSAATVASFDQAGAYVLRLSVSDSALSSTADVTITVNAATAGPAPPPTTPTPTPTTPVTLNSGQPATWTSVQTTIGNASYSPLQIRIVQSGGALSGSNRDNDREVDVSTVGTIDGSGNVVLTCTLTNGGSSRTVYRFTGRVSGSGSSQTISGTYTGTTPPEAGTFSMRHD